MAKRLLKYIAVLFVTILILKGVTAGQSPEPLSKKDPIHIGEIVEKLRLHIRVTQSADRTNNELIEAIHRRGVRIVLDDESKAVLNQAGASLELVNTIDQSLTAEQKARLKEVLRLEDKIRGHFSTGRPKDLRLLIEHCREYLRWFGEDEDPATREMAAWIRASLPTMERRLKSMQEVVNPFPRATRITDDRRRSPR